MERLKVIVRIEDGQLTVAEAAESLGLSQRQLYRLLQRYRTHGEGGLCQALTRAEVEQSLSP